MTRSDLALLSQAHAVAYMALAYAETGKLPMGAARALEAAALDEMPGFAVPCTLFAQRLHQGRHSIGEVVEAGRALRDAVARAMAYQPPDKHRVDIHG
jgi:hypothetical protein